LGIFKLLIKYGNWQTILNLKRNYVRSKALSQVYWKPRNSHFWAGLIVKKKFFFPHVSFSIKDVSQIRFWEDKWRTISAIYNIVHHKLDTSVKVMETSPPNVTFI
jgi:hypothetical protein